MKKIIITIAFEKQADHPITFEEIDIELQDGDIINAGYEEPFYGSDSGHDGYFYLHIERKREETDEEEKEREEEIAQMQELLRKRRYENYLKLKKEFENITQK